MEPNRRMVTDVEWNGIVVGWNETIIEWNGTVIKWNGATIGWNNVIVEQNKTTVGRNEIVVRWKSNEKSTDVDCDVRWTLTPLASDAMSKDVAALRHEFCNNSKCVMDTVLQLVVLRCNFFF